ncbi:MAG: hypothetical protein ACKVP6_14520, partial [Mycobacterium sp.]
MTDTDLDLDAHDLSSWTQHDWVQWRTRMLRSGDPYWQPIADRVAERGVDPQTSVLADLWQ